MRLQSIKASTKHVQISKAQDSMLVAVAISAVVVVFSLLSAKALLSQSSYQHKVLKKRNDAVKQLQANISAAQTLKTQYDVFEQENPNVIGGQGGTKPGNGPSDGDNARIVLDALPSQYDFPALISSVEKIVNNDHIAVQSISGTDDSGDTSGTASSPGEIPQATPMAFSVTVVTDYTSGQTLLKDFERSIRPFDITNLSFTGAANNMTISVQANTFYQPGISLQVQQEKVN